MRTIPRGLYFSYVSGTCYVPHTVEPLAVNSCSMSSLVISLLRSIGRTLPIKMGYNQIWHNIKVLSYAQVRPILTTVRHQHGTTSLLWRRYLNSSLCQVEVVRSSVGPKVLLSTTKASSRKQLLCFCRSDALRTSNCHVLQGMSKSNPAYWQHMPYRVGGSVAHLKVGRH